MSGAVPQQFCVRWNSYQSNLQNAFPKLLTSEHFVDVTLACENEMLKCHKVVLSACSTYFEKLLLQNPCQHPIIFMKDMRFAEMQSLVDFMYKGEVNVTQDDLPSLLKSAEALQIRGLCGSDQMLNGGGSSSSQGSVGVGSAAASAGNSNYPTGGGAGNNSKTPMGARSQNGIDRGGPLSNSTPNKPPTEQNSTTPTPSTKKTATQDDSKTNASNCNSENRLPTDNGQNNPSSSECDSNDAPMTLKVKFEGGAENVKVEAGEDGSYYEGDAESMLDSYLDEDCNMSVNSGGDIKPDFAIANVSCQYDGGADDSTQLNSSNNRRIRRSDEELRRAAECITRGQTFQTVSDQYNIPISTIRFYMARKGILPRRKRGRACAGPSGGGSVGGMSAAHSPAALHHSGSSPSSQPQQFHHHPAGAAGGFGSGSSGNLGNVSPVGPPYQFMQYKLPHLGVGKMK